MPNERPSPFTIPEPTFIFAEGPAAEPPPAQSMTVEGLIHNLTDFAEFYERSSADIEIADVFEKARRRGERDANADYYQRCFRATPGIDRIRAYVLARFGEELTIGTARRLLGDLIRTCSLTAKEAEQLLLQDAMDRLDASPVGAATPPEPSRAATSSAESAKPNPAAKRSTERGEGRVKLIAALTKHHQYADGGCLNPEPIGNNELANAAGVSPSTASAFFEKEFQGHTKYRALCRDVSKLAAALKLLNGEFAPHTLYGSQPEDDRDDE